MRLFTTVGILALASNVLAQNVTHCVSNGVCFAVNIPETTASSGTGDIYIQMSGPSSLTWIGLGQGSSMAGSNIFMIYSNAAGNNVTISPRLGTGHQQPAPGSSSADITLLEGSGIKNGVMTANFKCSNCNTWNGGSMSFTNTASNWIWAYLSGSAVASDGQSARLSEHSAQGRMTLNLRSATGGSDVNPFLGTVTSSTPTSSGSNPASTGISSGSSNSNSGSSNSNSGSSDSNSGSSDSNSGSSDSDSGSSSSSSGPSSNYGTILMVHGILAPVGFVILFPLGAIVIRLFNFKGLVWLHAGWMSFAYLIVLASMGLGVWIANTADLLDSTHAILGLVVVGCLLLQPVTGIVHHLLYKRTGGKNMATYPHVWWGRAIITLGIINGGFGLKLADNTRKGEIAYGVVAGFMWVLWMAVVLLSSVRSRGKRAGETGATLGRVSPGSDEKIRQAESEQQSSPARTSMSDRDNIMSTPGRVS